MTQSIKREFTTRQSVKIFNNKETGREAMILQMLSVGLFPSLKWVTCPKSAKNEVNCTDAGNTVLHMTEIIEIVQHTYYSNDSWRYAE